MKRTTLAVLAAIGIAIIVIAVIGLMHTARLRRFLPAHSSTAAFGSSPPSTGQAANQSSPFSLVPVQVRGLDDGYDYVRIDDPSTLPYKLLPNGCKLADFVFIDDQGNVLDRLTHDLPL